MQVLDLDRKVSDFRVFVMLEHADCLDNQGIRHECTIDRLEVVPKSSCNTDANVGNLVRYK